MTTPNASLGVWCYKCGATKLASLMRRINKRKTLPDGTRTGECKACAAREASAWLKAAHRRDPARRQAYNQKQQADRARRAAIETPEQRENRIARRKASDRKSYARLKADPERYARYLAYKRRMMAQRSERRGSWRERTRRRDPERYAAQCRAARLRRKQRRLALLVQQLA